MTNPSSGSGSAKFNDQFIAKGIEDTRVGPEVKFDAGGPDQFGHVWVDSDAEDGPEFNWIDVLATGIELTGGLEDDNFSGPISIGFPFPFYDSVYTHFYLGSNGFIGFGPTANYDEYQNSGLPSSATPNNIVAWCWDDLNILDEDNPGGRVVYEPTSERCVIQFDDFPEYGGDAGDVIDAQVILYPDGTMKFQYHTIEPGFHRLGNTIGIENADGTDGLEISRNTSYLHDLLAIEIARPSHWLYVNPTEGQLAGGEIDTLSLMITAAELDSGMHTGTIKIYSNDPDPSQNPVIVPLELLVGGQPPAYICGDADQNEVVNISDVTSLISYIFGGGAPPEPMAAGDVDCNDVVNISDATYLISYIFGGGPEPCADCP
jgi:hypothetical protein